MKKILRALFPVALLPIALTACVGGIPGFVPNSSSLRVGVTAPNQGNPTYQGMTILGVATAPTASPGTATTQLGTTAFTAAAVGVEAGRAEGVEGTLTTATVAAQSTANAALPAANGNGTNTTIDIGSAVSSALNLTSNTPFLAGQGAYELSVTGNIIQPVTAPSNDQVIPIVCNDSVPNTTSVPLLCTIVSIITTGAGNSSNGDVALQALNYNEMTGINAQAVSFEAVGGNLGTGQLTNEDLFMAKPGTANGVVSNLDLFYPNYSGGVGNVTKLVVYGCSAPGGTVSNDNCLIDSDPNGKVTIDGQIYNSTGEEVVPPPASPNTGARWHWGVYPGSQSGTVTNLNTDTLFSPFFEAARYAPGHIAVDVTTAVSGATCNLYIFSSYLNRPYTLLGGPYSVSAATAGIASFAVTPSITMDGGVYYLGVNCTSNSVAIGADTDAASQAMLGASNLTGTDTAVEMVGTAPATGQAVTYISTAGVVPQIGIQ